MCVAYGSIALETYRGISALAEDLDASSTGERLRT